MVEKNLLNIFVDVIVELDSFCWELKLLKNEMS